MKRDILVDFCNDYLSVGDIKDYTVNGLQIAGGDEINKIITAVTASKNAIQYAIDNQAQGLLVHHGYFWKNENPLLVGMKGERIKLLMQNNINLLAYHLPLDIHPVIGNNVLLAKELGLSDIHFLPDQLLLFGSLNSWLLKDFVDLVSEKLNRKCLFVGDPNKIICKVALCTGSAHDYLLLANQYKADVFISGEYAERTYYEAIETGCAYISAGHHATERFGVMQLGNLLAEKFAINHHFFDEPNPF